MRMNLLRARGGLRATRFLLYQQQKRQQQGEILLHNNQNYGLRFLATFTRACDGGDRDFNRSSLAPAPHGWFPRNRLGESRPSRTAVHFSVKARPSRSQDDEDEDIDDDVGLSEVDESQGLSLQESRYNPALGRYPWEEEKNHLAELDDGDKVDVFNDRPTLSFFIKCNVYSHIP